jgi:hypothetical protein
MQWEVLLVVSDDGRRLWGFGTKIELGDVTSLPLCWHLAYLAPWGVVAEGPAPARGWRARQGGPGGRHATPPS